MPILQHNKYRTQDRALLNSTVWGDRVRVTVEENVGEIASPPPRATVPGPERRWMANRMAAPADHPQIP